MSLVCSTSGTMEFFRFHWDEGMRMDLDLSFSIQWLGKSTFYFLAFCETRLQISYFLRSTTFSKAHKSFFQLVAKIESSNMS